jgi:hypothetical protein
MYTASATLIFNSAVMDRSLSLTARSYFLTLRFALRHTSESEKHSIILADNESRLDGAQSYLVVEALIGGRLRSRGLHYGVGQKIPPCVRCCAKALKGTL